MTSFVQTHYPDVHPGVARVESVVASAQQLGKSFNSTKGLAAMLLAAVVAALVVVADQLVDTWADGHLLAAWVVVWLVGFAAMALLASTARETAVSVVRKLDGWAQRRARARADERLWTLARSDSRVMADLQAAMTRQTN
jgi:hypothetical protein